MEGQGQSGQAIKLLQITAYVNDFQTLSNPGRRLEKREQAENGRHLEAAMNYT